jgi:uncharacterized protein
MADPKLLTFASLIIVLVGSVNCGLYGLFHIDLIIGILGGLLGRLVYILIGAGAGYLIYTKFVKKLPI